MKTRAPAPGSVWDTPFEQADFAFVDLEMTGLDTSKDRVIELCIVRKQGGVTKGSLSSLVKPTGIAIGNTHIHGLTEEALANAPAFADLASEVAHLLEGAVFVAHGALWDIRFLEMEFSRLGQESFRIEHYIDTLNLSRRSFILDSHSLDALCKHFGIVREREHRAHDDVLALTEVFDRCTQALLPKTPRDLWEVRVGDRMARAGVMDVCRDALEKNVPVYISYRPSRKPAIEFTLCVTAITLTPPKVLGFDARTRGRRELRAERILTASLEKPS